MNRFYDKLDKIDEFKIAFDNGFQYVETEFCDNGTGYDGYTQVTTFKKGIDNDYLIIDDHTQGISEDNDDYYYIYSTKNWEEYKKMLKLFYTSNSEKTLKKYLLK